MQIYIPIETRLQWIQDDIAQIKQQLCFDIMPSAECPDCNVALALGSSYGKCPKHAPEFNMRIDFPL